MLLALTITSGFIYGQSAPKSNSARILPLDKAAMLGPEYDLVRPMMGSWQVQQRTWAKAGAKPVSSPPFRVRRQLIGHFLQEVMEPVQGTQVPPFTRLSYLNFNNANRRWEYIVLDTRWPAMMFETSTDEAVAKGNQLSFYLDAFVMPPMMGKEQAGQLARQRRTITLLGPDQQLMRQYLTLPAGKEYLAIEYVYTRVRKDQPAVK
ncbi:DUF1579 family protein [Spirosoma arcticum]